MKAITFTEFGDVDVLQYRDIAMPEAAADEILVKVHATSLNRIDLLQRQGKYPRSPDDNNILGLDIAGEVAAIGSAVQGFNLGDGVFGLVKQGGYAEYCCLSAAMAMPIPAELTYAEAAAIPEVFFTADETVFNLGRLQTGQDLLLHAAGSGVGMAALQMAKAIAARVFFTAGSDAKINRLLALGGDVGINYREEDFLATVLETTDGIGVDVVEDFIGQAYFARNLKALKSGGRLIQVAFMSGAITELDLAVLQRKRLQIKGSTLRSRPLTEKIQIRNRFMQQWLPLIQTKKIKPIIDSVYALQDVKAAHLHMQQNLNLGKIILQVI